jgi:hypothetical protein
VIRVTGFLEIGQVAANASRRSPGVLAAGMTGAAVERRVHPGEGESRELCMIKSRTLPVINGVTVFARGRKSGGDVVRRRGLLIRSLVARVTLDRQPLKLAHRSPLVAVGAVQPSVPGHEREPIVMLAGSLCNDVPTLHGVALLAARTHLPAVEICVTISAVRPDIGKDRLGVALRTGDPLMQAAQRIFCCVVIEFRNGPNGFPTN